MLVVELVLLPLEPLEVDLVLVLEPLEVLFLLELELETVFVPHPESPRAKGKKAAAPATRTKSRLEI